MTSDLSELYQEVILDHNRRPRNFRVLAGETIEDVSFEGAGCAISKASASMMTDALKGRTVAEADALFVRFHRMVTTPPDQAVEDMGKLSSLAGVREFPVRVKCASLAWHTYKAALAQKPRVSTE